jgi:hypothetical protein
VSRSKERRLICRKLATCFSRTVRREAVHARFLSCEQHEERQNCESHGQLKASSAVGAEFARNLGKSRQDKQNGGDQEQRQKETCPGLHRNYPGSKVS